MNKRKPRQIQKGQSRRLPNDLRVQRRERRLNPKQVAAIIGISVNAIHRYERGTRRPSLISALKLQILYRSQIASFYHLLYHQLAADIRAGEERVFGSRERRVV